MAKKKRRHPESAAETLDAIESRGDRLVEWITDNPAPILATGVAILAVAGIWGFAADSMDSTAAESAAALSRVQADYRVAMGATPGTIDIPEPANAELAQQIRTDHVAQFRTVAEEHPGTTAAALALLEAGKLQQQLDDVDAARATFEQALEDVPEDDPVRAFLLIRLGSVYEAEGNPGAAADAYQQAAAIEAYPLRYEALADAARILADAGDHAGALAAYERIETEAPDFRIAPYIEARLSELRAATPN